MKYYENLCFFGFSHNSSSMLKQILDMDLELYKAHDEISRLKKKCCEKDKKIDLFKKENANLKKRNEQLELVASSADNLDVIIQKNTCSFQC